MTDAQERTIVERLARHLATRDPSDWPAHVDDAASLLAVMKEPDAAMRAAGDEAAWRAMIDAALTERWAVPQSSAPPSSHPPGADEEGEIALPAGNADDQGRAAWVHLDSRQGPSNG